MAGRSSPIRTVGPPRLHKEVSGRRDFLPDLVRCLDRAGATPVQVALACLLSKANDIVPIPGTKQTARVEENCTANGIELSHEQIQRLDDLTPAAGGHHNEEQMRLLER
jgi:aryl-alcohol dehydrogenase-like predicted oxidoreductase